MNKTDFLIEKMDCPSEENLIRMKLDDFQEIQHIDFDLQSRQITVYHNGKLSEIEESIKELKLGGKLLATEETDIKPIEDQTNQRKLLWSVLFINFAFFVLEILFGFFSKSMGLVADSLDMLADSFVYAISLFAVGGTALFKKKISKLAGIFQIALAVIGFTEVIRRFIGIEEMPQFLTMISISTLALIANSVCLYILQKSKSKEAHMQASMIFTSNDVIINLGVIVAGILVFLTETGYPDLIVGAIVFLVVMQGAVRILKLSK